MAIYPVILAGGSGTRLWPLSRRNHPKQFLDLLDTGETLLQSSILRARSLSSIEPLIIAHKDHRFLLQHQIEHLTLSLNNILLEPCSRNTAPAIALACLKIFEKDSDAQVVIMPSDHYISDDIEFTKTVRCLSDQLKIDEIGLIGVLPTFPSSDYGYFEMDLNDCSSIKQFIEKPAPLKATSLIKNKNFVWNSGVVVGRVDSILEALETNDVNTLKSVKRSFDNQSTLYDFNVVGEEYAQTENQAFDVLVLENFQKLKGIKLKCEWDDLGTWPRLLERRRLMGLKKYSLFSEQDKVLMFAMDEVVLVENDDLIFVAKQDDLNDMQAITQYLCDYKMTKLLDRIDIHRPWGQFKVLAKTNHFIVKHLIVHPSAQISLQSHHHRNENWVVIRGSAEVELDGNVASLKVGEAITIKKNQKHRLSNKHDEMLEIIEVQTGSYLDEDDIVRYDDQYLRHLNH